MVAETRPQVVIDIRNTREEARRSSIMSLNSLILTLIFVIFLFNYLDNHFGVVEVGDDDYGALSHRDYSASSNDLAKLLTNVVCDEDGIIGECTDMETGTPYYLVLVNKTEYDEATAYDEEADSEERGIEVTTPTEDKEKRRT